MTLAACSKRITLGAVAATLLLLLAAPALAAAQSSPDWEMALLPAAPTALPPLPPTTTYPVQLVLDDDTAEGAFGVANGPSAREFMWFNRFTPPVPFTLSEVWVLFPVGQPGVVPGAAVQIAIYEDADSDPSNGATLRSAFATTIQVADGNTFSLYPLVTEIDFAPGADVLIGVVPRFIDAQTPITLPAAIDTTASQGRSWVAVWTGDPPDPPTLPPDNLIDEIDDIAPVLAGNWMIRGFGRGRDVVEIPALSPWGLAALAAGLGLLGSRLALRRRASGTNDRATDSTEGR